MPKYASVCKECGMEFEWDSPRMTAGSKDCPQCHGATERLFFPVAAIWTKSLSAYGDPRKETFAKDDKAGGHWTFEKNSAAAIEAGKPLPVFIDTPQAQREYCKREGLMNPKDLPSNLTVDSSGKGYETSNRSEI